MPLIAVERKNNEVDFWTSVEAAEPGSIGLRYRVVINHGSVNPQPDVLDCIVHIGPFMLQRRSTTEK